MHHPARNDAHIQKGGEGEACVRVCAYVCTRKCARVIDIVVYNLLSVHMCVCLNMSALSERCLLRRLSGEISPHRAACSHTDLHV